MLMDGHMSLTTQAKLESHILEFYTQLYTRDEQVESNEDARNRLLSILE